MTSTTLRRSITAGDPRSPLQLATLTTSFPQHQLITSFSTLQASPFQFSPTNPFTRPTNSPLRSKLPLFTPNNKENVSPTMPVGPPRRRSSSLANLIKGPKSIPGMCACGHGRRSAKHMIKDCPRFESEREQLVSKTPVGRSPMTRSPIAKSPRSPQSPAEMASQRKLLHVARKWRMRTLLGKYQLAVETQQKSLEEKRAQKAFRERVEGK